MGMKIIFKCLTSVLDEESLDELLGPGKMKQWTDYKYTYWLGEDNNRNSYQE